jgi:glycosyltransferase involved in cell wall biosynthesis
MPNISIPGDVEGFGIAALEAGACGLPVIAANIQGIRDAVIDGVTGYLVGEQDVEGFLSRIQGLDLNRRRVRSEVAGRFSWNKIGLAYAEMLSAVEEGGIRPRGASF